MKGLVRASHLSRAITKATQPEPRPNARSNTNPTHDQMSGKRLYLFRWINSNIPTCATKSFIAKHLNIRRFRITFGKGTLPKMKLASHVMPATNPHAYSELLSKLSMGDEKPMSASTGAIKKKKDEKVVDGTSVPGRTLSKEKYTDLYNDLVKPIQHFNCWRNNVQHFIKRDHTQAELTKNILAKAKLESLCRELQKQNKIIKVKEEEERRREVATSFTEKLNLLTTLMDENKDKRAP
ncbi:hypothetical protein NQ318_001744 [Aromia moschata]|uniref:Uncharacterized protein n=1 Tax=Aromia moschata TaxID=1265417 RepID=A0AAV8XSP2_9CUCU|nr:hypothetical protein NQ318_001744 [Aromia moschata]